MALTDTYATIDFFSAKGATTDTTPVEVLADPGSGARAFVVDKEALGVLNRDTVANVIIVTITGGTSQIVETVTLDPGDRWTNTTRLVVEAGETLTLELQGAATTNQMTWQVSYYQITD